MSIQKETNYYTRTFDEIEDRLDFVFYHPNLDKIKKFRKSGKTISFGKVVDPESIDYGITASGTEEGTVLFVNTQNITYDGTINIEDMKYLSNVEEKFLLKEGDIIITRSRRVGVAAIVQKELDNATFGSYIIRFRLKSGVRYLERFVVNYINSEEGQEQITLLKTGSTGANINSQQLLDIQLPNIDIGYQKKIIGESYPLIEEAQKLELEYLQEYKRIDGLLFEQLGITLPQEKNFTYFCDFSDDERLSFGVYHPDNKELIKSLKLAKYPTKIIIDVINPKYESLEPSKTNKNDYFTYVGLENVESNTGKVKDIVKMKGSDIESKSNVFKKGQLMFGKLRPYLNKIFILEDADAAIGSAEFFVSEAKENIFLPFVKYYLLSEATLRQTKWILSGASYPRLDEYDFLKIKIVIPEEENEQKRIVALVEKERKRIERINLKSIEKRENYKSVFKQMLHQSLETINI